MTVSFFVENKIIVEKIMDNKYIPFSKKVETCEYIIEKTKIRGEQRKKNSPNEYLLFTLSLIQLYTKLEIDLINNPDKTYDLLMKNGLLTKIISSIQSSEIKEFVRIFDMCVSDHY